MELVCKYGEEILVSNHDLDDQKYFLNVATMYGFALVLVVVTIWRIQQEVGFEIFFPLCPALELFKRAQLVLQSPTK